VYAWIGLACAVAGGLFALGRQRAAASFYASDVYGLTNRTHRGFVLLSAAFAAGFLIAVRFGDLAVPLLAVYTLLLILYVSSFLRGFTGEDE
jgi:hypothetical protein